MKTREKASNHKELKGKINTSEQMINMGAEEGSVKCLLKDSIQVNEKIDLFLKATSKGKF